MKGKNRCNKQLDFFRVRIELLKECDQSEKTAEMRDRELKEIRKQEQYRKAISCMEEEQYDKAIILFEGFPRDYEDARNNFRE